MNTNKIKIRTSKAPARKFGHSKRSKWRDVFEGMELGNWFLVSGHQDYTATNAAAAAYMKGRYSLYKHPTKENTWVFTKTK